MRNYLAGRRLVFLLIPAVALAFAACNSITGPGSGSCDPNSEFGLAAITNTVSIERPDPGIIDIYVERNGYNGPLQFDILSGIRVYGGDEFLTSRGVGFYTFSPNPLPEDGGMVRLHIYGEAEAPSFTNFRVYVRAFRGEGESAKECFGALTINMS